ncbi:phosphonate metabolism protein/1,5-bisphosphokinase (PRPP-forming) PhnN [Oxalobacteraceae bacterium CAVE-383]|nr:phosphonate metabolism protein/1,5-bisphosphokinase (PRPP-forming) PhnN [Oxalobacteraceae bacterium CAVE-383]
MSGGTFFFVVGPSGAGKDSLIDGARASLEASQRFAFAQRVITRPAGAPGEDHLAMDAAQFAAADAAGSFLITWEAHGLRYGLPVALLNALQAGRHVIANGSRAMVKALSGCVPRLVVIEVTAPPEVLAARIKGRGRETGDEIKKRLQRQVDALPEDIETLRVMNDGSLEQGIQRFIFTLEKAAQRMRLRSVPIHTGREMVGYLPMGSEMLSADDYIGDAKIEVLGGGAAVSVRMHKMNAPALLEADEIGLSAESFQALGLPEGAAVSIRRTPSPASRQALMDKVNGGELDEAQYRILLRDIIEGRYADSEIAAFLVTATKHLSDAEVLALAKVRAGFSTPMHWDEPIVVDKHSMGGIPGSRITLIVVPIVAAFGLAMPKTSSRAITSAAGTADAMEAVAKVDLDVNDVRRCVAQARACIAWNGRLNHSVVDDVMNAITRPLGINSNRWSVASILSKKLTAGSTHVIVDLPFGKQTKLKTYEEARALADLFEKTGGGMGLQVKAFTTDGSRPIGRGIGPALEVRDVEWVLDGHPEAPADLREKALFFASRILAWDPSVGDEIKGREVAEKLLASGAARAAFEKIIDAQGRRTPVPPGRLTQKILATRAGMVTEINGFVIAGIARRAGAPQDKGAGIDLLCGVGQSVAVGQPLFVIHSDNANDLESAALLAELDAGYVMES